MLKKCNGYMMSQGRLKEVNVKGCSGTSAGALGESLSGSKGWQGWRIAERRNRDVM
jgi:hypothetical protein